MISAIIPTRKGRERLERNLDSVVEALRRCGEPWEIVIVDDGGGGVAPHTRPVRVVELSESRGYGPAVNAGVAEADGELLLILNDDVRLEPDTVGVLRDHFPDPSLFAVVPSIRSTLVACGDEGGKRGVWEAGLIEIAEAPSERTQPTLYPVGCCYLCPSERYRELGGYDELLAPFFWEDVDLGYRAWRRGLRILHDPRAVCHHEGSATLGEQHTHAERERIWSRNRVLFHLRRLKDPLRRAESLGAWAAVALFDANPERLAGLEQALAAYARAGQETMDGLGDVEILERAAGR
jgi:GT2 family glycosyltransferase